MSSMLKQCTVAAVLTIALTQPAHASAPTTYASVCQTNSSDSDGDGWGWENSARCVISDASAQGAHPVCQANTSSDPDANGWGYQGGVSCLVRKTTTTCESQSSDPDGDGWGYENGRSCRVENNSYTDRNTTINRGIRGPTVVRNGKVRPVCEYAASDPDGDGWGEENALSCVVTSLSAPVAMGAADGGNENNQQVTTDVIRGDNPSECASSLSDYDGDGFGFEGGRTCVMTAKARPYPVCQTLHSDLDGNGYGFEDRQSCIAVEGVSADRNRLLLGKELCESWVEIAYGNYRLENNTWNATVMNDNSWSQCIELNLVGDRPVASWTFDWLTAQDGDLDAVKSYPQVYYGRKAERRTSGTVEELGLPHITSQLPEFKVDYRWSLTGDAEANVALESFFHTSCQAEHANKEYEMMVWVGVPKIKIPGVLVTSATIDGKLWDVYSNPYQNKGYVAFVAKEQSYSGTLNWNRFIEWSRDNSQAYGLGELRGGSCMGAIEIGTETFWGKGEFTLHQFDVRRD